MNTHRVKGRFIRKRKLSMFQTVLFLLFASRASLFQNLAAIKDELPVLDFPNISKQAISKARQGILPSLFESLFHLTSATYFDKIPKRKTWNGYHLFAIDGTRLTIPPTEKNHETFSNKNCIKSMPDKKWCIALGSLIYDVLEDIIVHASIHHSTYSERTAALLHLDHIEKSNLHHKSIVIFDRGYYSQEMYRYFVSKGYYCLMRLSKSVKIATRQTASDVTIQLIGVSKNGDFPVPIRFIQVELDSGETEYLATNLMDETITPAMFKKLYFKRWKIESKYNEIKNQLELEEFNGNTPTSIRQEFFISLMFSNISSIVKADADRRIEENKNPENKSDYQANRAFILGRIRKLVPKLLSDQWSFYTLSDLFDDAFKNRSQIQPNRKYERNKPKILIRHFKNKKAII